MPFQRFKWLINLRWLAAGGVLIAGFLVQWVFNLPIPTLPIFLIGTLLLIFNIVYLYAYNKISTVRETAFPKHIRLVIIQIICDLIFLTLLLHYSGGVENPFMIYYVFHMMLAGILLPRKVSLFLTSFALFLVGLMSIGEFFGWFPHYALQGFLAVCYYDNAVYLTGTGFVFVTTSYVVVYMTSTVSSMLRNREKAYRNANLELQKKDTIKDEYVSRITHDIKGHLAAVKNCLDASKAEIPREQQLSFTERASERTIRLLDFLRELNLIIKLRLNNERIFARISLKELIYSLISGFSEEAKEKGVRITAELETDEIVAEKLSLSEALENLISNSLKYTNHGGEIVIRSHAGRNKETIIQVTDTGEGIDKEDQSSLFREFYRGKNNRRGAHEGMGLGLAIVKMIVEQHRGKISLDSEKGKGTTFTIEIPRLEEAEAN